MFQINQDTPHNLMFDISIFVLSALSVDCELYSNVRCGPCLAASFCNSREKKKKMKWYRKWHESCHKVGLSSHFNNCQSIWNDPKIFQIDRVDCDIYSNARCGLCSAASFCNSRERGKNWEWYRNKGLQALATRVLQFDFIAVSNSKLNFYLKKRVCRRFLYSLQKYLHLHSV